MTKKRFTNGIHRIYENGEEIACADTMDDAGTIVDLLNEQEELINRLKTIREEQTETILKQKRKIKELETENKQLKQQCLDFMEMLDDMSIVYLLNEELECILGLTNYDKWVKKQTKRGKELCLKINDLVTEYEKKQHNMKYTII